MSQQDVPFTSLRSLGGYCNPSFTLSGATNVDLMTRSSWIGSNGSYATYVSNFNLDFEEKQVVLGLNTSYASFSLQQEIAAQLYGNYALKLSKGVLRFGLGLGVYNLRPDFSGLHIRDSEDPYLLSKGVLAPDIAAGITFANAETVFAIGAKHMNEPTISFLSTTAARRMEINMTVFHTLLLNRLWSVTPMLSIRYTNSSVLADVVGYFDYDEKYWVGSMVRSNGTFAALAGLRMNKFVNLAYDVSLGMAYDYTLFNDQSGIHGGNVEIVLKLKPLVLPDPEEIRKHKRVVSPMFL